MVAAISEKSFTVAAPARLLCVYTDYHTPAIRARRIYRARTVLFTSIQLIGTNIAKPKSTEAVFYEVCVALLTLSSNRIIARVA
jgi:hypothetical protein